MLSITKGEISVIRSALEEGAAEDRRDALEIVRAIEDKNVQVHVTEKGMYKPPLDETTVGADTLAVLSGDEGYV